MPMQIKYVQFLHAKSVMCVLCVHAVIMISEEEGGFGWKVCGEVCVVASGQERGRRRGWSGGGRRGGGQACVCIASSLASLRGQLSARGGRVRYTVCPPLHFIQLCDAHCALYA